MVSSSQRWIKNAVRPARVAPPCPPDPLLAAPNGTGGGGPTSPGLQRAASLVSLGPGGAHKTLSGVAIYNVGEVGGVGTAGWQAGRRTGGGCGEWTRCQLCARAAVCIFASSVSFGTVCLGVRRA